MVVAVWSVKAGVGVTSVCAMLALGQVQRAHETLLVDLRGELPAVLGVDDDGDDAALGIADWCALDNPHPDGLARLEVEARPDLRVLRRGVGPLLVDPPRLCSALWSSTGARRVIVDCGKVDELDGMAHVVGAAPASLLVMRECFLNLRAARASPLVPSGVIVLKEPGRTLGRADIESVTGAPVVAEFAIDAAVARALDAGLVRSRLPRHLIKSLGKVFDRAI